MLLRGIALIAVLAEIAAAAEDVREAAVVEVAAAVGGTVAEAAEDGMAEVMADTAAAGGDTRTSLPRINADCVD